MAGANASGALIAALADVERIAQVWHKGRMIWSPTTHIIAGGLGMIAALWSIRRRQLGKAVHPGAPVADAWLLVLSAALVCIGVARWPG